jgi:hypothetical protein
MGCSTFSILVGGAGAGMLKIWVAEELAQIVHSLNLVAY